MITAILLVNSCNLKIPCNAKIISTYNVSLSAQIMHTYFLSDGTMVLSTSNTLKCLNMHYTNTLITARTLLWSE